MNGMPTARIASRIAGMREGARVKDDEPCPVGGGLLHTIDDRVAGVALKAEQLVSEFRGLVDQCGFDITQTGAAIDARLASAQQVEVGSIDQEQPGHRFGFVAS